MPTHAAGAAAQPVSRPADAPTGPSSCAPERYDAIVIGGGLAGLTTALRLPPHWRIALLLKHDWQHSASNHAQGGIAVALAPEDSIDQHLDDTLVAGAGLCDADNTAAILAQARPAVDWLRQLGVPFTPGDGPHGLHLTREGGHGQRRIVHADDATGHAVMACLWPQVARHPGITLLHGWAAVDLLVDDGPNWRLCLGAKAIDTRSGTAHVLHAAQTVLATGGSGQLYPRTSNPAGATADGVAMAWRAGCRVQHLEFVQFHPTGLCVVGSADAGRTPLISEALRGEGALLRLPDGTRFMPAHDERAELAPRDIVARAIYTEMQQHGLASVDLDIRHRGPAFLAQHFPNIMATCRAHGVDPEQRPIPVAPLAHYACGGIRTDLQGRTDLAGLYAVGENACTGLHGANRLASNSLLECVVMGMAAAQAMQAGHLGAEAAAERSATRPAAGTCAESDARTEDCADGHPHAAIGANAADSMPGDARPDGHAARPVEAASSVSVATAIAQMDWDETRCAHARTALQAIMWQGAGIVRNPADVAQAIQKVSQLRAAFQADGLPATPSLAWLELRNLLDAGLLLLQSAQARRHSCGAHAWRHEPAAAAAAAAAAENS